MKSFKQTQIIGILIVLLMATFQSYAQIDLEGRSKLIKPETEISGDLFWYVKAFHPDAQLLKVKAIDKEGEFHDVKAIQTSESTSVLSVKAIIGEERLPIKLLPKGEGEFYSVKAIAADGTIIDVKAITESGDILDLKGVERSGNIIHLSALSKDGKTYSIIAISPFGEVNAVKGIKMMEENIEGVITGVSIFAHVKAIKQN